MQFLIIVRTILSLFPLIVQAITTVEAAFPVSGQGANKLDLIKQVLLGAAEASDDIGNGDFDKLWPAIQKTIGAVVGLFNVTGTFKK